MLVTTATVGESIRKLPSLSSASATRSFPWPSRALVPSARSLPPITTVGSRPARASTSAMKDVVVVLPCVPATAMPNFMRISSASISARGITGMRSSRARTTSGFDMPHRRGDHHHVDVLLDVVGSMADSDDRTETLEALRRLGFGEIRAADDVSHVEQHLGDAAHADAADADEMNVVLALEQRQFLR